MDILANEITTSGVLTTDRGFVFVDCTVPTFYDLENNDATMEVGEIYKLKGLFGSHKFFEDLTIKSITFIGNFLLESSIEASIKLSVNSLLRH